MKLGLFLAVSCFVEEGKETRVGLVRPLPLGHFPASTVLIMTPNNQREQLNARCTPSKFIQQINKNIGLNVILFLN